MKVENKETVFTKVSLSEVELQTLQDGHSICMLIPESHAGDLEMYIHISKEKIDAKDS